MNANEVIAKLSGVAGVKEALGDDGISALTAMLASVGDIEKKLQASEAKAARILQEAKEAKEAKAALEEDNEKLKNSSMSEAEKIKADAEKAMKRAEKAEKDLAALNAEYGKAKRAVALDKVASQVKFIDAIDANTGRILLEAGLASLQSLDDAEAVAAALVAFKEGHKTLIAADSQATGAGTGRPGASGGAIGQGKPVDKMSAEERAKDMREKRI